MHIPPTPEPPRKRHRLRNGLLSAAGVLVVLAVIGALAGNRGKPQPSPSPSPSFSPYSEQFQPSSPPLSAGKARFVAAIRSALAAQGAANTSTDAQLASIGGQVCKIREDGGTQSDLIAATPATEAKFDMTRSQLVEAAERDICPAEYPKPATVLLSMSGNGIKNSAPFLVSSGTLTVSYSYDCSSFGTSGNFIADLETDGGSDDQSIANALGSGGSDTTTIYPQDAGSDYHLAVDSECDWSVTVKQEG